MFRICYIRSNIIQSSNILVVINKAPRGINFVRYPLKKFSNVIFLSLPKTVIDNGSKIHYFHSCKFCMFQLSELKNLTHTKRVKIQH